MNLDEDLGSQTCKCLYRPSALATRQGLQRSWGTQVIKTILAWRFGFLAIATAGDKPALKQLYDQHRWFELREAIRDQHALPLYRGGVASAFDQAKDAEKYFNEVIQLDPKSDSSSDAHEMLIDLYGRTGRYQDALRALDDSLRIHPGRLDPVNERALFAVWAKHGDQSVADIRPSTFHGSVSRDGIVLPVLINCKTAHWALDTGA